MDLFLKYIKIEISIIDFLHNERLIVFIFKKIPTISSKLFIRYTTLFNKNLQFRVAIFLMRAGTMRKRNNAYSHDLCCDLDLKDSRSDNQISNNFLFPKKMLCYESVYFQCICYLIFFKLKLMHAMSHFDPPWSWPMFSRSYH